MTALFIRRIAVALAAALCATGGMAAKRRLGEGEGRAAGFRRKRPGI